MKPIAFSPAMHPHGVQIRHRRQVRRAGQLLRPVRIGARQHVAIRRNRLAGRTNPFDISPERHGHRPGNPDAVLIGARMLRRAPFLR